MARPQRGDAEVLREAKARFERCVAWESQARQRAKFDHKFANGDAQNGWQWDTATINERGNRPSLTHNKVRQHNLQVINDARQNKAQVKITPTGGQATYEAAQVFADIIRRIEYQSKATDAYSTATYHQVTSGIGYVTVDLDYADAGSFDQEIYIRRVQDPNSIYMDPDAKEYDKGDMKYAFVFEDIPRLEWEAEHGPHAAPPASPLDYQADSWTTKDHVRIALYWRRVEEDDRLHMLHDGRVLRESELDDVQMEMVKPLIRQSRASTEHSVEWYRIEGERIVERGDWLGKYIPVIPCIGEETVIDGVLDRKGHTRAQIDAQRIYNYWASSAVEQVALQSKTPYVGPSVAFEGFEHEWASANTKNKAFLAYNAKDDDGQPIPPPQRQDPPTMAQAYIQGLQIARQDLLDVTGQYQAELGMPSNERSGVAIQQRQRQGDNATYHYIDNNAKMIRQVGRVLLDLIPKVYDTTRVIKIMAVDGKESDVLLTHNCSVCHMQVAPDQPMGPTGPQPLSRQAAEMMRNDPTRPDPRIIFNPSIGTYDVEADVGPSYGTQRQEAANAFGQIMANNPAAFTIVGDLWAKNSDFPQADELAERLKQGLPPQYRPGPDPQVMQLQQALQQQGQTAQQLLKQADAEVAHLKAVNVLLKEAQKDKSAENIIDNYKAETERLKAVGQIDPTSLQVIVRQMVKDMLGTELIPAMRHHAHVEQVYQANAANAAPPEPPEPAAPSA